VGIVAPTPIERYVNFGSFVETAPNQFVSFFFRVPNPDLKPQTIDTGEASVIHQFGEALQATVAGYYSRAERLILTHLWPMIDRLEAAAEGADAFGSGVTLASQGLVTTI